MARALNRTSEDFSYKFTRYRTFRLQIVYGISVCHLENLNRNKKTFNQRL